jgi:hypothetical protein
MAERRCRTFMVWVAGMMARAEGLRGWAFKVYHKIEGWIDNELMNGYSYGGARHSWQRRPA